MCIRDSRGINAGDFKGALRQGAGLIKDHHTGTGQLFQIGRALDEDAAGGSAANAAEEAQRDEMCIRDRVLISGKSLAGIRAYST